MLSQTTKHAKPDDSIERYVKMADREFRVIALLTRPHRDCAEIQSYNKHQRKDSYSSNESTDNAILLLLPNVKELECCNIS